MTARRAEAALPLRPGRPIGNIYYGWGGRLVRIEQAQGILVAALGMLVGYYGYGKS